MPVPLPIRGGLPGSLRMALVILIGVVVLLGVAAAFAYVIN
jgi:hypothetical protein